MPKEGRLLLLNPPGDKLYIRDYYCSFSSKGAYYWPPQDLIYLSGLLNLEFDISVLDAMMPRMSPNDCTKQIEQLSPGIIIFATGSATMEQDMGFLLPLKAKLGFRLIASSAIFYFCARYYLERFDGLDACLCDYASPEILEYLKGKESSFNSIAYRANNRDIYSDVRPEALTPIPSQGERDHSRNCFQVPMPRHELFNLDSYRMAACKRNPFTVVVTSKGCGMGCSFCAIRAIPYSKRPVEDVIHELRYLSALGIREILFQDPTMNLGKKHLFELCEAILRAGLDVSWICNYDLRFHDKVLAMAMAQAGCHLVNVGIESGSEEMLKRHKKGISLDGIREAVAGLKRARLDVLGYFMLGLPGESARQVEETIDLARSLPIDFASFSVATPDWGSAFSPQALPQTESERPSPPAISHRERVKSSIIQPNKQIPDAADDEATPAPYCWDSSTSRTISAGELPSEELIRLRRSAYRRFYFRSGYILRFLLKLRNLQALRNTIVELKNLVRSI